MDEIKNYLLRLCAAALICGIAACLVHNKKTTGSLLKLICGVFLALTVLGPIASIRFDGIGNFAPQIGQSAQAAVDEGKNTAMDAWIAGIKESAKSYILDKAESYGAQLEVEITVEGTDPPSLVGVRLEGSISPYGKKMLQEAISQQLGIAEEDQIWIG